MDQQELLKYIDAHIAKTDDSGRASSAMSQNIVRREWLTGFRNLIERDLSDWDNYETLRLAFTEHLSQSIKSNKYSYHEMAEAELIAKFTTFFDDLPIPKKVETDTTSPVSADGGSVSPSIRIRRSPVASPTQNIVSSMPPQLFYSRSIPEPVARVRGSSLPEGQQSDPENDDIFPLDIDM